MSSVYDMCTFEQAITGHNTGDLSLSLSLSFPFLFFLFSSSQPTKKLPINTFAQGEASHLATGFLSSTSFEYQEENDPRVIDLCLRVHILFLERC
jgi:hypothetical protein